MESKIFCLVAFLALSAGVAFAQAQAEEFDSNSTTVASPSNSSEPNTTVSNTTVPTTAASSTITVPSSAGPSTEVPTATTAGSNTTEVSTITTANTTDVINGTTTLTPSSTPTTPCTPSHSFDAASFVGGIVLGLGVCIIVFFFYKWYQSRHPTAAPYQQF